MCWPQEAEFWTPMRTNRRNLNADLPSRDQVEADQENILSGEEDRARLDLLDSIRRRVEQRNLTLQRTFGSRSGSSILGFR